MPWVGPAMALPKFLSAYIYPLPAPPCAFTMAVNFPSPDERRPKSQSARTLQHEIASRLTDLVKNTLSGAIASKSRLRKQRRVIPREKARLAAVFH
jgi:hypothetical protein